MPSVLGIFTSGTEQMPCIVTLDDKGLRFSVIDPTKTGRDEPEKEEEK
jgi:hypothetical protein